MTYFGLDFGTANTSLALCTPSSVTSNSIDVLSLFNNNASIPSTYFFDFEDDSQSIGAEAFDKFYFGDRGRFLRSFKSALGTSTIDHEIQIKQNRFSIRQITQNFIGKVLSKGAGMLNLEINHLVVGRPVHFVDDDQTADKKAQQQLLDIVQGLGVKHVEFQFEPIAAALNYGVTVEKEETVLVVDIGAGTSDFSVVKFSPYSQKSGEMNSSQAEVISNCGIHLGGNDFDKAIALENAMPMLGYKQRFKRREELLLPHHFFMNAATWHKIDHLYDHKVINALKEIQPQINNPLLIQRFLDLIASRQLHKILVESESVKRELSNVDFSFIDLDFLERDLRIQVDQNSFNDAISAMCTAITESAKEAIKLAGLNKTQIDTVYITGGSMGIKQLFNGISEEFSDSKLIDGDRATSVAKGLALYSGMIFS